MDSYFLDLAFKFFRWTIRWGVLRTVYGWNVLWTGSWVSICRQVTYCFGRLWTPYNCGLTSQIWVEVNLEGGICFWFQPCNFFLVSYKLNELPSTAANPSQPWREPQWHFISPWWIAFPEAASQNMSSSLQLLLSAVSHSDQKSNE